MTEIYGVSSNEAIRYVYDWWFVIAAGIFCVGAMVSYIKDIFKD